jgi:hypothetical protein
MSDDLEHNRDPLVPTFFSPLSPKFLLINRCPSEAAAYEPDSLGSRLSCAGDGNPQQDLLTQRLILKPTAFSNWQ